jgi:hypothetical protein
LSPEEAVPGGSKHTKRYSEELKRDAGVPVAVGIGLDTAEREEFKQLRKLASDQAKTIEILKKRRPSSRRRACTPVHPHGEGPLHRVLLCVAPGVARSSYRVVRLRDGI